MQKYYEKIYEQLLVKMRNNIGARQSICGGFIGEMMSSTNSNF